MSPRTMLLSRLAARLCRPRWVVPGRGYYVDANAQGEPFHPIPNKAPVKMEADKVFEKYLNSHQKIFVHGGAATPNHLLESMVRVGLQRKVKNVSVLHIHTEGPAPYNEPNCEGAFRSNSLFTSKNCRQAIDSGRADFTPIFLSEIPLLFRQGVVKLDMAIIMVTPPDKHGFCSLGPSVDCARAAIQNARVIVAQVNPNLPRTRGDSAIHSSHLDCIVERKEALHEMPSMRISPKEQKIGQLIASNLVTNGATLQTGIGSIPDAVLASLTGHKDLGINTEMFSDGVVDLTSRGIITNSLKHIRPGKIVSGFVIGTKKVFDFIDENAMVELCDIQFVNKVCMGF